MMYEHYFQQDKEMWVDDYYNEDNELDEDDFEVLPNSNYEQLHSYSFMEMVENCVSPVLHQAVLRLVVIALVTLILGEMIQNGCRRKFASVLSVISGSLVLLSFVNIFEATSVMILFTLSYPMCLLASKYRNTRVYLALITAGLLYLVVREHVPFFGEGSWASTSGIAMIGWMKAMSLVYELSTDQRLEMPSVDNYFAYLFYPATIAFGPWVSYSDHCSLMGLFLLPSNYKGWILLTSWKILHSFGYLLMSTCFIQWLLSDLESIYLILIRDALTVRFSHYFVCKLSEALCQLNGPRSPSDVLSSTIVTPLRVEFPRSLVDVVVHWNIPMHYWLKKHVYTPLMSFGKHRAALATFFVSALLHGLNFRVSTVLISLGIYCYIEFTLRDKLAYAISSCIKVRSCDKCDHKFKNSLHVHFINFCFHALAIFNLAYVGVVLDNYDPDNAPVDFYGKIMFQLSRWNQMGYSSHLIMTGLYGISLLFKSPPMEANKNQSRRR